MQLRRKKAVMSLTEYEFDALCNNRDWLKSEYASSDEFIAATQGGKTEPPPPLNVLSVEGGIIDDGMKPPSKTTLLKTAKRKAPALEESTPKKKRAPKKTATNAKQMLDKYAKDAEKEVANSARYEFENSDTEDPNDVPEFEG